MKYKINEKIKHIASNKICIIVATRESPWEKKNDVYNRGKVFPKHDYLILIQKESTPDGDNYSGELDVLEDEICGL